jgi:rhodanese-related sulfurtransferase
LHGSFRSECTPVVDLVRLNLQEKLRMPIEIRRKDVKTLVSQNRAQLLEVLPHAEYEKRHLLKAINIPLEKLTAETTRNLKKDTAVIVYSSNYQCDISARAAWRLESMGFQEVYRYTPGKEDWIAAGLDVEGSATGGLALKQYIKKDFQTCLLRDRMQEVQNRRGRNDVCVVLNDRNIVMGLIEGDTWNANPLARAGDIMRPGPRTFRPTADPKDVAKELKKEDSETAIVTTSDGELLGILRMGQKKSHKPDKPHAA